MKTRADGAEAVLSQRIEALRSTLRTAARHHPAVLASSLSAEDMVITDVIARDGLRIGVFTIDTGRLHQATHTLLAVIAERYGIRVEVLRPRADAVTAYEAEHGRNAFFRSLELRHACCHVRKIEPLERALSGKAAWVTGLRREQSISRAEVAESGIDPERGIPKFNPLADWSESEVWAYLRSREVPYNALHDDGYRSIGCAPCTRPVTPAEDVRAGRWWWEAQATRECGIHLDPAGRLIRAKAGAP